MQNIHTFIGAFFVLYVLIALLKGRVTVSEGDRYNGGRTSDWITRSKQPVQFWLFVIIMLAVAAVFLLNPFHFPF